MPAPLPVPRRTRGHGDERRVFVAINLHLQFRDDNWTRDHFEVSQEIES